MGRVYFPTRNDNGVRDMSQSVTLGRYLYTDYRAPAEPAAKAAMNPVNLGSLGMNPNQSGPGPNYIFGPGIRAAGPSPAPVATPAMFLARVRPGGPLTLAPSVSTQSTPTPQVTVPPAPPPTSVYISSGGGTASPGFSASASTAAQTSGTPVPTGFPTNSVFINQADGSQWEYSSSQGKWISVGTPYNLGAPSAPPSLPAVPSMIAPASYALTQSPAASAVTAAPVSASLIDQFSAWLGSTTPLFGYNVPNALLAGGVALGAALLMGSGGKKR